MDDNQQLEEDLNRPKVVETEAGRVEFVNTTDAIKLNEYRKKQSKSALARIGILRIIPDGHERNY